MRRFLGVVALLFASAGACGKTTTFFAPAHHHGGAKR
jgi:hypothetical protein